MSGRFCVAASINGEEPVPAILGVDGGMCPIFSTEEEAEGYIEGAVRSGLVPTHPSLTLSTLNLNTNEITRAIRL